MEKISVKYSLTTIVEFLRYFKILSAFLDFFKANFQALLLLKLKREVPSFRNLPFVAL